MTAYWEVNLSCPQALEYVVLAQICVLAIMIHCVTITCPRKNMDTLQWQKQSQWQKSQQMVAKFLKAKRVRRLSISGLSLEPLLATRHIA